jgi:hypothetical protein
LFTVQRIADGCDVYWTFFDNNSTHVTDGMIEMTKDDFHGFSWAQNAGQGLEGVEGYLVFTSGDICYMPTNTRDIFANAFMVDTSSNDAVFIPVVPLNRQDYDVSPGDLTTLDENDLRSLTHGIQRGTTVDMRYWTDPAYGAETLWIHPHFWGLHWISSTDSYVGKFLVVCATPMKQMMLWFSPILIALSSAPHRPCWLASLLAAGFLLFLLVQVP